MHKTRGEGYDALPHTERQSNRQHRAINHHERNADRLAASATLLRKTPMSKSSYSVAVLGGVFGLDLNNWWVMLFFHQASGVLS
jgi:hypothetical protein